MTEFKVGDIVQMTPKWARRSPSIKDHICEVVDVYLYADGVARALLVKRADGGILGINAIQLSNHVGMFEHRPYTIRDRISIDLLKAAP